MRYLVYELGPNGIHVHAMSPGPVKTRAAFGIDHLDDLIDRVAKLAPARSLVSIEDARATAFGFEVPTQFACAGRW